MTTKPHQQQQHAQQVLKELKNKRKYAEKEKEKMVTMKEGGNWNESRKARQKLENEKRRKKGMKKLEGKEGRKKRSEIEVGKKERKWKAGQKKSEMEVGKD